MPLACPTSTAASAAAASSRRDVLDVRVELAVGHQAGHDVEHPAVRSRSIMWPPSSATVGSPALISLLRSVEQAGNGAEPSPPTRSKIASTPSGRTSRIRSRPRPRTGQGRAEGLDQRPLVLAGRADHVDVVVTGDLCGGDADAAADAVDQQRLAGLRAPAASTPS